MPIAYREAEVSSGRAVLTTGSRLGVFEVVAPRCREDCVHTGGADPSSTL
jgi:hypothetical protein